MSQLITTSKVVAHLANGQEMSVPIYQFKGSANAPSVYIQANMHGAEVQGNAVIYQLLEQLRVLDVKGDITLVPLCNPIGINQKSGEFTLGRFDPITGNNWNRGYHFNEKLPLEFAQKNPDLSFDEIKKQFRALIIGDLETQLLDNPYGLNTPQHLCATLQRMAFDADIVLDLHTGPISERHLYCPEYTMDSATLFDIPHTLFIPSGFDGALDEAAFCPWWQLQLAYQAQGREIAVAVNGFTLELGSQEWLCLEEAKKDSSGILSYLSAMGVVERGLFTPASMTRYACYLKDYRALYSPKSGLVEYLAPLGKPIRAGEPLVRLLRMDRYDHDDVVEVIEAPQDCIAILHFASASVNQGTELYKVFSHYFTL